MLVINSPRGGGKTTKLIKLASKNPNSYIVCHNQLEVSRITNLAKTMGKNINFPLTMDEFIKKQYYSHGIKSFLIDNVEMLLQKLTSVKIDAITINKD